MPTPTPIVWKKIIRDASGRLFDVDQDLTLILPKPEIFRDASGTIIHATGDKRVLRKIAKSLEKNGRKMRLGPRENFTIDARQYQLTHPINDELKRLCIKMSIAVARSASLPLHMSLPVAAYLAEEKSAEICPVRIVLDKYLEIDRQRPPLGHLVYVRGCAKERRVYSVVQFFGVMQFYCELTDNWIGDDCAIMAVHDPITHKESITSMLPGIDYAVPPQTLDATLVATMWQERLSTLRLELVSLYGDQAPLSLELDT